MRRTTASIAAATILACALFSAFAAGAALAQDDPMGTSPDAHGGHAPEISLSELTAEDRVRALDAWSHVYCNCPVENWSRTLANCPDGCAVPQKQQVLRRIREGWPVEKIVAEQVQLYGQRAAADPGTAANGTLFVLAGLVAGAGLAGLVLAAWRKSAAERRVVADTERRENPVVSAEAQAVERELEEID